MYVVIFIMGKRRKCFMGYGLVETGQFCLALRRSKLCAQLWEHGSLGPLPPRPELLPLFQSLRSEGIPNPTGMKARRG